MRALTSPTSIVVPEPQPDATYSIRLLDRDFAFVGLKRLLGAADFSKAGDRRAGLAAESDTAREAARSILSDLTLRHLFEHPLTDSDGRVDEVMRVNYDIDRAAYSRI